MLGKPVADFSLRSTGGTFRLKDGRGKKLVLYYYPKDNTPRCTHPAFRKAGVAIYGISRDSLTFELLSDADEAVCQQFGVMKIKNMYGRKVRGIERSTFLLDEEGVLARAWRGVKVPGHVQEVLNFAKAL